MNFILFIFLLFANCLAIQADENEMQCKLSQLDRIENWFLQSFEKKVQRTHLMQTKSKEADPNIVALENALISAVESTNRKSHERVIKDLQRICAKKGGQFDRKTRECF
jgi:hypothetical protein